MLNMLEGTHQLILKLIELTDCDMLKWNYRMSVFLTGNGYEIDRFHDKSTDFECKIFKYRSWVLLTKYRLIFVQEDITRYSWDPIGKDLALLWRAIKEYKVRQAARRRLRHREESMKKREEVMALTCEDTHLEKKK